MQHKIQEDITKKDMRGKSSAILIPTLIGCIILGVYYIFSKIHVYLWLAFIFSYGLWFSVILLKYLEYQLRAKYESESLMFYMLGFLLYCLTLAYLSQSFGFILSFRRTTFLVLNGIGYLLLMKWLLRLKVHLLDFTVLMIYALLITYCFTDTFYNTFNRLDLLIATWSVLLLLHSSLIIKRQVK